MCFDVIPIYGRLSNKTSSSSDCRHQCLDDQAYGDCKEDAVVLRYFERVLGTRGRAGYDSRRGRCGLLGGCQKGNETNHILPVFHRKTRKVISKDRAVLDKELYPISEKNSGKTMELTERRKDLRACAINFHVRTVLCSTNSQ